MQAANPILLGNDIEPLRSGAPSWVAWRRMKRLVPVGGVVVRYSFFKDFGASVRASAAAESPDLSSPVSPVLPQITFFADPPGDP